MSFRVVRLPGSIVLVPGGTLEGQVRRQARDHPALPNDPNQIGSDLTARTDGVPATLDKPRSASGDWSLLVYARSYVVRLFLTKKYQDAYTIAAVNPLQIRDHHRLAQGCLLLQPTAGWRVVFDPKQIPKDSKSFWSQIAAEWQHVTAGIAAKHRAPVLTPRQTEFLDTLDRMIDATQEITTEADRSARPFPYRRVTSTGERREGARAVYEFHLAGPRRPDEGAFVQLRGEPEQRGQVTRVTEDVVTIRFDQPVDWKRIAQQGEIEVTLSTVVFDKQREAVAQLRARQVVNRSLLSVVVDHQVGKIRPKADEPTEKLDSDQLEAFRKALAVEDMLLILGPPGTGKTRTISQIARACAADHARVLVTSHTHRAVDNMLTRLPPGIQAVRVGHVGKVTEEGKPYLLERQAAELRDEILNRTGPAVTGYQHVDLAVRWAEQLDERVAALRSALGEQSQVRAGLDAARRAVGGMAQTRVDRLAAEHQRVERAVARNQEKAERLAGQQRRANARAGWPVFGPLFGMLTRRWARRLVVVQAQAEEFRAAEEKARSELAGGEHELDAVTRDDPSVRAARTAVDEATQRCEDRRAEALVAARSACGAVGAVVLPPTVRDNADLQTTAGDLADLSVWLETHLPLLAARGKVLADWREEASGATNQLYPELIRYADVIAATCIGAASRPELADLELDLAIVDEAGQIGMADVLVPLARARRGVLVGDHKQLPPFLDSEVDAWGAGIGDPVVRSLLSKSALELLLDRLPVTHVVMLTQQRRMPSSVADFISASFYENKLETAVERNHRDPLFRSPMAFVDTTQLAPGDRHEKSGRDRERWGQPGYTNLPEAELLTELAAFYHALGLDWAIIVPYRAQVAEITSCLVPLIADSSLVGLNVGTVDSFQGGERDVILFGFTRSNHDGNVGFLKELRRANVAFTRVKQQLVLVGDLSTLMRARDQGLRELVHGLRDHLAQRGEICQYDDVRRRLTELAAEAGSA